MLNSSDEVAFNIGKPYSIKISRVRPNPNQPRRYFSESGLIALANSIQETEQQVPISVRTIPNSRGEFEIIDGERRWRAHKIIWERTGVEPTIQAFLTVVKDEKELYRRSVVANLHSENFTELDEAAALDRLNRDGDSISKIAHLIDKSPTYVVNRIKIHGLPEEVKVLMSYDLPKDKRLSITSAIDIALSTKNDELRVELAKEAIARQLGVLDMRLLISTRVPNTALTTAEASVLAKRGTTTSIEEANAYKRLSAFIGKARKQLPRLLEEDFEAVFFSRANDREERASLDVSINNIIVDLSRLQSKLRSET